MSPKTVFFTICSNNYLGYAQILLDSLKQFHPEASLYLCLADLKVEGNDLEGVNIIEAKELGVPNFSDFAFRYDVMEFNTALKPFMMSWLLETQNFEQVIYLDPDIEVFAPLTPVLGALEGGHHFVLTPHLTQPAEINAYPDDVDIMKAGIYNLGFIAVSNHPDVYRFLHWWGRRLRFQCLNQQNEGIFVDQKFVDLLPAFCDQVAILRDTTLNVAYWNLTQRVLTYEESCQQWFVDGMPLTFFHFSGINPKNKQRLSKHTKLFNGDLSPALKAIVCRYIEKYQYNVNQQSQNINKIYHYEYFSNGLFIPTFIRHYYRELSLSYLDDPFENFFNYLNEINLEILQRSQCIITNLMYALWCQRKDLKQGFPLDNSPSVENYARWFVQHAYLYKIDEFFLKVPLDFLAKTLSSPRLNQSPTVQTNQSLVAILGYLKAENGVGHAARLVSRGLEQAGILVEGLDIDVNVVARREDSSVDHILCSQINAPVHIYKVNADQLGIVKNNLAQSINRGDYNIAMPLWELSIFPSEWLESFGGIQEVWAESEFVRAALQTKLNIPVYYLPPAVTLSNFENRTREYFNLPDDRFLFHFNFDFSSYSSRKNPRAVISAYRRAFRHQSSTDPTALVIKVRGYDPDNEQLNELQESVGDGSDIIIINQQLSHGDTLALMNCCDCYVSLHRSEGFGFTLAEAMLLNKPVISTNFSSTRDFLTQATGFPIAYQLIPLKAGDYPFFEHQHWADPDIDHAAWTMRQVVLNPQKSRQIAYDGKCYIQQHHSLEVAGQRYVKRLQEIGFI